MKNTTVILTALALVLCMACERVPKAPPEKVTEYITIEQLRNMFEIQGLETVDTSVYIQGVITLTPELGNVPDFVAYIQDTTDAICITVSNDNNTLAMNSEVKILCEGVGFTEYNGLLQFGNINIDTQVETISLDAEPVPDTVTVDELNTGEYQAHYVIVNDVQFEERGTFSGSRILTDCKSDIVVYTRADALFSSSALPTGLGYLKGVSSVFNKQQILLRSIDELSMTGTRCSEGGSSAGKTYLSEDFTAYKRFDDAGKVTGWNTFAEKGSKTWYIGSYSDDNESKWVQVSAYKSGDNEVVSWLVSPEVDLTDALSPVVSFKNANGYDNGATLQFYVSTDYAGSETPWLNTWNELSFTEATSVPSGFGEFVSSEDIDISSCKGKKVYFAWVYKGGDPQATTTWEIDDVVVKEP